MGKFKAGDRVGFETYFYGQVQGTVLRYSHFSRDKHWFVIKWDDGHLSTLTEDRLVKL